MKFKTFNKQEHDSDVPPRKIQRIVEDKNGYIWVKTIDRKLYVFNKVTECFHAVYDDMKNLFGEYSGDKITKYGRGGCVVADQR